MLYLLFALSVVFVEGATELICKSLFFAPLRVRLSEEHTFFKELLGCGYCTSVWVALWPAAFFAFKVTSGWLIPVILVIPLVVVLHRLANFLHNFNDKHLDKFYSREK